MLIISTDFDDLIQQTQIETMPTGKQEQKTTPEPIAIGIILLFTCSVYFCLINNVHV